MSQKSALNQRARRDIKYELTIQAMASVLVDQVDYVKIERRDYQDTRFFANFWYSRYFPGGTYNLAGSFDVNNLTIKLCSSSWGLVAEVSFDDPEFLEKLGVGFRLIFDLAQPHRTEPPLGWGKSSNVKRLQITERAS